MVLVLPVVVVFVVFDDTACANMCHWVVRSVVFDDVGSVVVVHGRLVCVVLLCCCCRCRWWLLWC